QKGSYDLSFCRINITPIFLNPQNKHHGHQKQPNQAKSRKKNPKAGLHSNFEAAQQELNLNKERDQDEERSSSSALLFVRY
ncbi:unnamed protein product, partial [Prunus brigantina]